METDKLYFDYPSEPIGGNNPYHRCADCKRSAPEINGKLERYGWAHKKFWRVNNICN